MYLVVKCVVPFRGIYLATFCKVTAIFELWKTLYEKERENMDQLNSFSGKRVSSKVKYVYCVKLTLYIRISVMTKVNIASLNI